MHFAACPGEHHLSGLFFSGLMEGEAAGGDCQVLSGPHACSMHCCHHVLQTPVVLGIGGFHDRPGMEESKMF